jgi:RNA polymerase sigma-70 factor (ECF subfamily)
MPSSETQLTAASLMLGPIEERPQTEGRGRADALDTERLRAIVVGEHAFVWRMLRRSGVSAAQVDEAVSRVFDVLMRRLGEVLAGKEQAFLARVCVRVASEFRRGDSRRVHRETLAAEEAGPVLSPEEIFEKHEALALLDEVLEELEPGPRVVFVLHEMEQWTAARIAVALGLPPGTVASRLRRGREQFERAASQLRRKLEMSPRGGKR